MSKVKLETVKSGSYNQALLEQILDTSFEITESSLAPERRRRTVNPRLDNRSPNIATFLKDEVRGRTTNLRVVRAGISCGKAALKVMEFADKPVLEISRFVPIINESDGQVFVHTRDLVYSARLIGPNLAPTENRANDTRYQFQYNASEILYGAYPVPEHSLDSQWGELSQRLNEVPPENRLAMFLGIITEPLLDLSQAG